MRIFGSLSENFQTFYYEVLRQKERALRLSFPANQFDPLPISGIVEKIQTKLKLTLQEQALKVEYAVGLGNTIAFKEAQYLMVALVDEIFLTLNWPGAKLWEHNLLEAQLFHTQIAGEFIFKKLDLLLESHEPYREELAYLYFIVLSLGFRGQYAGVEQEDKIQWYLDHLYKVIHEPVPKLAYTKDSRLIGQCYNSTITDPPGKGLPDNRFWGLVISGIVVLYLLITYIIWYSLAAEVQEALNLIFEQTHHTPLV